jgi:hypothetical protein
MLTLRTYALALVFGLAIAPLTRAQDPAPQSQNPPPAQERTNPAQPLPPDKSADDQGKPNPDDQPISPVVAGTVVDAPLGGAAMPIIGLVRSRSYVVPALSYYGLLDSNANNAAGNYQFASINTLMASLAVQKLGRVSQFNLGYLIGRSFSNAGGEFNSTTHDLVVSDLWSRGRWDGFIFEKLLYSSEAGLLGGAVPFDNIGLDNAGGLNATGPIILHNSFVPGQGIFTGFGPRLHNSTVGQVTNHMSRRTYFTLVGNYDSLHFFNSDSALIDTSATGFQAGLGYQRTREDTIAVLYRYTDFWFGSLPISVRDNILQLAYQRQLGQRVVFQIGAGPEFTYIHDATLVGGTVGTPLPSTTRTSWSLGSNLQYRLRRVSLRAGYDHFLTAGYGVFLGAITDRASFTYSRQLSRVWNVSATASYAHNVNLVPLFTPTQNIPANASYDSMYAGFEAQRRVGRDSEVFFGYVGRYQTASYVACLTGICKGSDFVGHQVNFGFSWRLKPFPVD